MSQIPEPAKMNAPTFSCNDDVCTKVAVGNVPLAKGDALTDYSKLEVDYSIDVLHFVACCKLEWIRFAEH
jgi:hypothetical protein